MTIYRLGEGDLGGKEGTHKMTYFYEKADTGEDEEHYGDPSLVTVGRSSYPADTYAVMEWDISSIPTNLILSSATLSLMLNYKTAADFDVSVHEMLSPFVVGDAEDPATAGQSTWNWAAQPTEWAGDTGDIATGGGVDWVVTPTATLNCYTADQQYDIYTIDLTTLLDAKLAYSQPLLRILFKPLTTGTNWTLKFYGQANITENRRPELTVVGTVPDSQTGVNKGNPEGYGSKYTNPFPKSVEVDISAASQTFENPVRGLLVTGSGNIVLHLIGDPEGTYITLPVAVTTGHYYIAGPFVIDKIIKTGTTATVIKGLY